MAASILSNSEALLLRSFLGSTTLVADVAAGVWRCWAVVALCRWSRWAKCGLMQRSMLCAASMADVRAHWGGSSPK